MQLIRSRHAHQIAAPLCLCALLSVSVEGRTAPLIERACPTDTARQPSRVSSGEAGIVQPGEIRVDGVIDTVRAGGSNLVLKVNSYTLPGGQRFPLDAPRPKLVVLSENTSLYVRGEGRRGVGLSQLRPGLTAFAVGRELGDGRELPAREVALWDSVNGDNYALSSAPPTPTSDATPTATPVKIAAPATQQAEKPLLLAQTSTDQATTAGSNVPGTTGAPTTGIPVGPADGGTGAPSTGEAGAGPGSAPGGPPGAMGGPPPLPVLLGIAEFLIVVDKPFQAEDMYRGILARDAENKAAQQGLKRAKDAQGMTLKVLSHNYTDTHDVHQYLAATGVTLRTRHGNYGLSGSTGYYRNNIDITNPRNPLGFLMGPGDDRKFRRNSVNLDFDPRYGKYEGRVFLSQVNYDGAPDRTLYDLGVAFAPDPARERYSINFARRDSILQSSQALFFGPESFLTVVSGLTINEVTVAAQRPLGSRIDLYGSFSHFRYNDPSFTRGVGDNVRNTYKAAAYYRVLEDKRNPQKPVARIGLGYINDDTKFPSAAYYAPEGVQSLSLVADYVRLRRGLQYGIFGGIPIGKDRGTGFAKHDPPRTLFGFVNYDVSKRFQLFANVGIFRSPKRVGNQPGRDLDFNDFVLGVSTRF